MSVTHDVISGMSHVPCTRVLLPWGRQKLRAQFEYKRAQVTNDGHHRRCLSTKQGTENGFSEVVSVLVVHVVQASYLDKENQELVILKYTKQPGGKSDIPNATLISRFN